MLDHPLVEFIGEIGESQKSEFLGRAKALLFPIDWPEPFGLVLIEALACGTPIVAFSGGSVPEILEDGVTGFVVQNLEKPSQRLATLSGSTARRVAHRLSGDSRHPAWQPITCDSMSSSSEKLTVTLSPDRRPLMAETVRLDEQFYIVAETERSTMPLRVLKHGDSFAVFDTHGDITQRTSGELGLYTAARVFSHASSCCLVGDARCSSIR